MTSAPLKASIYDAAAFRIPSTQECGMARTWAKGRSFPRPPPNPPPKTRVSRGMQWPHRRVDNGRGSEPGPQTMALQEGRFRVFSRADALVEPWMAWRK